MGNNFYVGEIFHSKKYTKPSRIEKAILYSEDSFIYIDLLNQKEYTTDNSNRDYVIKESLINFTCIYNNQEYNFSISSIAKHNIGNAMIAILIGFELGLSEIEIKQGLANIEFTQNRLDIIKTDNYTIIDDSYNSSYDSVMSALEVLNSFKERKVAIIGDIFELGRYSESIHKKIGQNLKCDVLVTIGKNAKYIFEEALNRDIKSYYYEEKDNFYKEYKTILLKDDVILIKASNGMKFKEIVNFLKEV